jgi:hypothetical protein
LVVVVCVCVSSLPVFLSFGSYEMGAIYYKLVTIYCTLYGAFLTRPAVEYVEYGACQCPSSFNVGTGYTPMEPGQRSFDGERLSESAMTMPPISPSASSRRKATFGFTESSVSSAVGRFWTAFGRLILPLASVTPDSGRDVSMFS